MQHAAERPGLEVRGADRRVEPDPAARAGDPQAEVDVLHRGVRVPVRVEASGGVEGLAADRAQSSPERGCWAGASVVYVMVEQVPEGGDDAGVVRLVVVGAEERRE